MENHTLTPRQMELFKYLVRLREELGMSADYHHEYFSLDTGVMQNHISRYEALKIGKELLKEINKGENDNETN